MIRPILAALVATTVLTAGCFAGDPNTVTTSGKPIASANSSAAAGVPATAYHEPDKRDFDLTIKTLEKTCFGEAGCNITFRVKLAYDGSAGLLNPTKTYELTYEIRGGEDPLTNTLTVTGDSYEAEQEEFIGTASSSDELTAVVTEVAAY